MALSDYTPEAIEKILDSAVDMAIACDDGDHDGAQAATNKAIILARNLRNRSR
ncbi:hypothetical protein SAMN05421811_103152 [Nonomuraea wenchangensis]|uniref:HEPN domain-containing protein n=2 Tax=Nonomuraea wenchangensis TaxID=568860 RepID=A0A1I0ERJ7_9ACTN|nr:hypothetical protein SAMN05421811_103152 [Nonomuraea wenchangensis]